LIPKPPAATILDDTKAEPIAGVGPGAKPVE